MQKNETETSLKLMADLSPLKHFSIVIIHVDVAFLEFVKVHLKTLSYLEMI